MGHVVGVSPLAYSHLVIHCSLISGHVVVRVSATSEAPLHSVGWQVFREAGDEWVVVTNESVVVAIVGRPDGFLDGGYVEVVVEY